MERRIGLFLLTLGTMLSVAAINSQAQTVLTRHVRDEVRTGQTQPVGHLPSNQTMSVDIVLPLRDPAGLDSFLQALYDPASPSYRQFLTVAEFTERFGPSQQAYDSVVTFAKANGFTVIGSAPNRMNVHVQGTVANIESAFHVRMATYQHPTENRTFFSADREPTVALPFALWHVAGLDNFSIPQPAGLSKNANPSRSNATTGSGPSASFLGSDMRAAYYGGTALTGSGQSLGLLEYYGTDLADLTTYFTNAKQTNAVPVTLLSTDGTSTACVYPSCDDTEQTLDITQALGMAPGLSSLVVYVGSTDAAIFNAMATHSPLNAQLSSSWTWYPADPSTDNPYFQEFAAQGQNLFQAAGDSNKWTPSSEIFPADDVYVTSVGGTDLNTGSAGGPWSSETAWVDNGGGISPNKFAIPSWQTSAAAGCANCSKTYRNGPDVSANANFTFYVCADQTTCTANSYGGTSFAAPMWAGYLALVNQQAVTNGASIGKGGVGFINPSLYAIGAGSSYGSGFHDITSGSNGYSAATGYDLVTGWGSPNGSGLINALAGPPSTTPAFSLSASPASLSVVQGNAGTSIITTVASGTYNSAIALSASGQPTGVTVNFSPTSIAAPGSGTSTATFTVASTTVAGTYTITVTGNGGGITQITTISLTVTKPASPAFAISVSPTAGSLARGQSGYAVVTTTATGGFNSAVALSATGLPSGVTGSFSPASIAAPGAGTSHFTLTVSRNAGTGTYPITIKGTGGGSTHTTTLTFTVLRYAR
jgi:kumamolisin